MRERVTQSERTDQNERVRNCECTLDEGNELRPTESARCPERVTLGKCTKVPKRVTLLESTDRCGTSQG
jgi:hypothetical protein